MEHDTNPGDSTSYLVPTITINNGTGFAVGSIYDRLGIPTQVDDITINALPLRAYNLIYNTWFRDENLQNSLTVSKTDGPDALLEYLIKTYTLESETVLDNCMGSGTTGVACKNLNRNFIGIELDPEYFKIAEKRINENL